MSKKRSWLCVIKRLFFPETQHQQPRKFKRRRWLIGRLKGTKGLPSPIPAEVVRSNPATVHVAKDKVDESLKKYDEDVGRLISKCAGEVLKPKEVILSEANPKCTETSADEANILPFKTQHDAHVECLAATKIQTAYRGHLAKKALRALRGFVALQAIIRGRSVRRQAAATLKCLQSIVSIQSEVCARRRQMSQGKYRGLQLQDPKNEKPKTMQAHLSKGRRLDDELLAKDKEIDIILRKKEAILRRQTTRTYTFNHRSSTDSEDRKSEGRLRYWLEQYASDQLPKKEDKIGGKQPKLRNLEALTNPDIISVPRRSFHNHKKQNSQTEDGLHPTTDLPTYMAATKSAKAKTRSLSSPRMRPSHFDAFSDNDSPYKHKLSPMSSINSEVTCTSVISKVSNRSCYASYQQKSPSLKGLSAPVRSYRNMNDTGLDSEKLIVSRRSTY